MTDRPQNYVKHSRSKVISLSNESGKVKIEFKSPKKEGLSYANKHPPVQLMFSYQKQLLARIKKTTTSDRYSQLSARESIESVKEKENEEDIFVKR